MKAKNLERKIARIEGVDVKILHNDRKINSNAVIQANYDYERAAPGNHTAADLIQKRLAKTLPGYTVEVLDSRGTPVAGNTKLKTFALNTKSNN